MRWLKRQINKKRIEEKKQLTSDSEKKGERQRNRNERELK
jgi:hypothetical protein